MCGIYGIASNTNTYKVLNSLEKLEYRGYDSCGITYILNNKPITYKAIGNTSNLKKKVPYSEISCAIGHTRWATHGAVNEINAHPHTSKEKRFYIAHNGVIDNYIELKNKYNINLLTETDSEIIAHLLDIHSKSYSIIECLQKIIGELKGSYAVVIIDINTKILYFIKNKSPLLIGEGVDKIIISSDQCVFEDGMNITILNDYNYGYINENKLHIYSNVKNEKNNKFIKESNNDVVKLNDYYMLDEMYYEIEMIKDIANKYKSINNTDFIDALSKANEICFIGAGSSYYASCILKDYYEEKLKKRCHSIVASEFYNFNILTANTVFILLSQSGETADLCEVINNLRNKNYKTILLCNNINSTLGFASDIVFPLFAKSEISVASTKAFTAMVYVGMLLLDKSLCDNSDLIAKNLKSVFSKWGKIQCLAKEISASKSIFYLGKGKDYSIALEGSLKLRELSYLHAFAFQAGELKHGSIALVDNKSICIAIVSDFKQLSLVKNNLEEVRSRGAKTFLISNCDSNSDFYIEGDELSIILLFQILAYQTAYILKRNIDQPRNLAKSVTVI